MSAPDILIEIAEARAERVRREGAAQGVVLPGERTAQRSDFLPGPGGNEGILIAEVKRRSPSKGAIAEIPDPVALAAGYRDAGFRRVSVLTEEARFGGSLADLMAVKNAFPDLAVLRKDFLLTEEDIEVSARAGADAVLLIAALLDETTIRALYRRSVDSGMTPLVEIHDAEDAAKVRPLAPPLVGINSRDLRTFRVDPLTPLEVRSSVDWPCAVIYESGIAGDSDVAFVRGTGFSGFLAGEAPARNPDLAARLVSAWTDGGEAHRLYGGWSRLYERFRPGRPLVKICGITNRQDGEAAVADGADMLGFIMAESPRRVEADLIRGLADLPVLKAAVVVLPPEGPIPPKVDVLLEEGALDFIQFHGDESPATVSSRPGYKALRLREPADAAGMDTAGSPAVLVDAFSRDARGGTGKRLSEDLVAAAAERRRLWLAGGLDANNVRSIVQRWNPGLVDVSSGVEAEPGRKDRDKVRRFIEEARR